MMPPYVSPSISSLTFKGQSSLEVIVGVKLNREEALELHSTFLSAARDCSHPTGYQCFSQNITGFFNFSKAV